MSGLPQRRACARPGCTVRVSKGLLACRPDWYTLPADLRRTITDSYRPWDKLTYRLALVDAMRVWGVPR